MNEISPHASVAGFVVAADVVDDSVAVVAASSAAKSFSTALTVGTERKRLSTQTLFSRKLRMVVDRPLEWKGGRSTFIAERLLLVRSAADADVALDAHNAAGM